MRWTMLLMVLAGTMGGMSRPAHCFSEPNDAAGEVMRILQAAQADRDQLVRAWQTWQAEKEKLGLLLKTLEGETARYRGQNEAAQREIEQMEQEIEALQEPQAALEAWEQMLGRLSGEFAGRLEDFKKETLPGIVPVFEDKAAGPPFGRFREMVRTVKAMGPELARSRVEIVSGRLGAEMVTVKLMRVGGVAGWWMALDYSRAGYAWMEKGQLRLRRADDRAVREAIRKGLDILEGRRAADFVVLGTEGE